MQTITRQRFRRTLIVVAPLAVATSIAAVASAASSPGSATEVQAAEAAFQNATVVAQTVVVPPTVPAMARQSTAGAQAFTIAAPSTATLAALKANGQTALSRYYAGPELAGQEKILASAASQESDPTFRALGGGADNVHVVSPTEVAVAGTVRTWSKIAQIRPTDGKMVVAAPANVLNVRAVIDKDASGAWHVTSYSWTFAPGSEPSFRGESHPRS